MAADGPGKGGSEAQPDLAVSVTHLQESLICLPGGSWYCPVCGQKPENMFSVGTGSIIYEILFNICKSKAWKENIQQGLRVNKQAL